MNFIKPQLGQLAFELQLNVPMCLVVLPNPSRTTTEVEENLLYVGDVPQEQEEEQNLEEEGSNLHHHEEHHQYDVGDNYNDQNNRWAWMQTRLTG